MKYTKRIIIALTPYLPNDSTFTERLYHIYYDLYNKPRCKECDKETKIHKFFSGYSIFCSSKCNGKNNNTLKEIYSNPKRKKEVQKKKEQTCLDKYGVNNVSKKKEIKNKIKQTNLERYGVEWTSQNKDIKEKQKETLIKNYGVESPFESKKIRDKSKQTFLERYGVENSFQSEEIKTKINKIHDIQHFRTAVLKYEDEYQPLFTKDEYNGILENHYWKCITCNKVFDDHMQNDHPRCLKCDPIVSSKIEIELQDFCKQYFSEDELLFNDRTIIKPLELDIVIPSKKIAIELNGNYWHSELNGKNKNYHLSKSDAAKKAGYQLIHIFEDEWVNKQSIVKSILLNKLGKTPNKIGARKCKIIKLNSKNARSFLNQNHMQGHVNGTHYGLTYNAQVIAVMTVGKPRFNKNYNLELLRFCVKINYTIMGGLSKLIKHVKNPGESILSYADKRYSNGGGYVNIGFKWLHESSPNYFYINKKTHYLERETRNKYQKHKLSNLLDSFDSNKTEWENMQENKYDRIWDCGNIVLELK